MRHDKALGLLQLARQLASTAEGLTLDEMAKAAGVGRRTAERMRDALWALFPQMEEVEDGPGKRFRIGGGLDGLFQCPTTEELLELSKAASRLRSCGSAPRAQALESLEHKVRAAMRAPVLLQLDPDIEALVKAEAIAVQAGPRPFEDVTLIAVIRDAVKAMKALAFTYAGGSAPGARRVVTPCGLMFGRANYLVAFDAGGSQPKNWRLDRIGEIEILDRFAQPPQGFDLKAYAAQSFGIFQDGVEDVVLKVLPDRAEDALGWMFHPTQEVERQSDGSVTVRFRASGMKELAWHLFTWGDAVEIDAPDRLKQTMREELAAALARHGPV